MVVEECDKGCSCVWLVEVANMKLFVDAVNALTV